MERILVKNVWTEASRLIKHSDTKIAAIAYVTKGTPLKFGDGDVLICDASDAAIRSGATDGEIIRKFHKDGAELYSCQNLHAKVLISGALVVIGSANLSASSDNLLLEAALFTTRTYIRSQVRGLIDSLIRLSTLIDETFITHILSLPVTKRFRPLITRRNPNLEIGNKYWIVNTHEIENYPDYENKYIEKGEEAARKTLNDPEAEVEWLRFTGNSRFRKLAKKGDTVVEIANCGSRAKVSTPRAILYSQPHEKWTRFYLEEQKEVESWTTFKTKLKKIGLQRIGKTSLRELSQREILLIESIWR